MGDHLWVEMTYTVIDPELQDDGSINVYTTEAQQEAGQEQAKHGCWFCFTPLNKDTIHTECSHQEVSSGRV